MTYGAAMSPAHIAPSTSSLSVPRWFSCLSALGLGLLRPFVPASVLARLEHAAWFIAVGAFNTLLSYLMFVGFLNLAGASRGWALFGAYGLGMFVAYYNFSRLVFKGGARGLAAWLRFAPGYVVLFAANRLLLEGLVLASGWSEELSQFLLLPVVALLSYLINRFMVFRV